MNLPTEQALASPPPSGEPGAPWTQTQALQLCAALEGVASDCGFHVALTTGGLLYRTGERKCCDLVFYPAMENTSDPQHLLLLHDLGAVGLEVENGPNKCGWVWKAKLGEQRLDLFFPHLIGRVGK